MLSFHYLDGRLSSLLYTQDPVWHSPLSLASTTKIPHLDWLLDKGSLTQKLIDQSDGDFRVSLIQQSIQAVRFSEQRALNIHYRQWALTREVVLYGKSTPWVYARTIIPLATLRGSLRRLHYLGNRPLGEALFADPSMQRGAVEIARLQPQQLPDILAVKEPAWGRRSVFRLSNKPLLVSEIFLPALFQ